MDPTQALEETLHTEIPLTVAMGLQVAEYAERRLTLRAPLAANINHKETAFAGSLNALATLAGWGILWLLLREAGEEAVIIIQESVIDYRRPVTGELVASCQAPEYEQVERFLATLRSRGKARMTLGVQLGEGLKATGAFKGRYIAHRPGAL